VEDEAGTGTAGGIELEGKVAVVTGGGGGIGANVARAFGRRGVITVVNDVGVDIDGAGGSPDAADRVVEEITAEGGTAIANYDSVATFAGAESLVDAALSLRGRLDIVVNCAGIAVTALPWDLSESQWDSVIDVHLKGHFAVMRAASRPMRAQRSGTMITVSSRAGLFGVANAPAYCSAKAGITGLTKAFALAIQEFGVTVNAIVPSATTRMSPPPSDPERLRARPESMAITEADSASADDLQLMMEDTSTIENWLMYLATPSASGITGNIYVVAGRHIALLGPWNELVALDAAAGPWSLEALCDAVPASQLGQQTLTSAPR
jgi:NAD(P)-dependent dehydrogenase (short-subunit alcohol dehydrogenase family)